MGATEELTDIPPTDPMQGLEGLDVAGPKRQEV